MNGIVDFRLKLASDWVQSQLGDGCEIADLAGDASFRRYFRVIQDSNSYVLMDAPPEREPLTSFLAVRDWLAGETVHVPKLIAEEQLLGFLLLEDFGDVTWADHLDSKAVEDIVIDQLFADALRQLRVIQDSNPSISLPDFDIQRMQQECNLYLDWYLPKVVGERATERQREDFHAAMLPLLKEISGLPQTPVHLDFHSRNLMLPSAGLPLGVIDFQDAVIGPVTYDLASLLYDCYQNYPETLREEQSMLFFESLPQHIGGEFDNFEAWHRAVRLTAMQRHIKAIGIFARLAYRDGKLQFLDEIPLTRLHLQEEMRALGIDGEELSLLRVEPVIQIASSESGG